MRAWMLLQALHQHLPHLQSWLGKGQILPMANSSYGPATNALPGTREPQMKTLS